ncbi:hypothetical protein ODJ79_24945 [Actinoplanes sp. KI2]|uniref:hypothetical protein n=1 Tax=Actinoplanes sp. KI2 TaxID=2983315 RepID=UPI0021D56B2B|nr:hypothetical protein [Actinoplanes sp. KI2]MCU7726988.1 hypothetical protein [Actinoplanes sp. KI2]
MRTGRAVLALVVAVVGLSAAFVIAPGWLASDGSTGRFAGEPQLAAALRRSFADYWGSGDRTLSPDLQRLADYWSRYHVAKGVIASLLLIAFVLLGVLLWRAFRQSGGRGRARRAGLAAASGLAAVLALFSSAVVMANAQGAVAPFASLMPLLVDHAAGTEFAGTLDQVRAADASGVAGSMPPALQTMTDDFARYHVAMVVIAGVAAVVLAALAVTCWRRFAHARSAERGVWAGFGVVAALSLFAVLAVAAANATTAADPAPAFAAFLNGGW